MFIGEGQQWFEGEEQAWQELEQLDPEDVCRRSKADFNATDGHYVLPLFSDKFFISPERREIWGNSPIAEILLSELPHYARVPALCYLVNAQDLPATGNPVNPREIKGGHIFTQGSYVLPLDRIVENYGNNIDNFLQRGMTLGSEQLEYGDSSLRLFPFPRVPIILVLWRSDEEFPARADILFDETCSLHLPTDILWATAMTTILMMTR